jgi:hypothetical protein
VHWTGSRSRRFCLVAPRIPAFTRTSAPVEFNLGQRGEILLDHFQEAFRLGRVLAARLYDQRVLLFAGGWARNMTLYAEQQNIVLLAHPSAEPDLVFAHT